MTAVLDRPVAVLGATTPRLYTRPLVTGLPGPCSCGCALTPETSAGFQAVEFAETVVGFNLHPWQRWVLIHALELRPDGLFRFKTLLILIARQNGKTAILKILALYFLYLRGRCLVLGAAQSLDIAKEAWRGAVELAQEVDDLADEVAPNGVRIANGDICLTLDNGSRYRITAATRSAGRGLSVDLLILDELREHRNWEAWGALSKTTTARPGSLIVGISNAGDDQSVVLNSLRGAALAEADDTLGLFEFSAPDGCALDDLGAIAQANPSLNHPNGVPLSAIMSALGTDPAAVYRTETLCQRVEALDNAVDVQAWRDCADSSAPNLGSVRERVAACLDVAPDGQHVTLCGAAVLADGRARVEVLGAWASTTEARRELGPLLKRIRPAALAWFPSGPAAALSADLRALSGGIDQMTPAEPLRDPESGRVLRPCESPDCRYLVPVGVLHCCGACGDAFAKRYEIHAHDAGCSKRTRPTPPRPSPTAPWVAAEIKGAEVGETCQEFADLVIARKVEHPDDPLLNAHVAGASPLHSGDGWRFTRKGAGHVDAAYAAAGAVHLARTLPPPVKRHRARVF